MLSEPAEEKGGSIQINDSSVIEDCCSHMKLFDFLKKKRSESTLHFVEVGFHGDRYLLSLVETVAPSCSYFIETGTNGASTIAHIAKKYSHLQCMSCEPDADAFKRALKNTEGLPNVKLFNETSQEFLRRLEKDYEALFSENILFCLDAHGYGFQWPLKEEISFVTSRFKSAYILIGDFKVPGLECFGYDVYEDQECSFEFIQDDLTLGLHYNIYYPDYTEKTSEHHLLRGWVLFEFGHEKTLNFPEVLTAKLRQGKCVEESCRMKLSLSAPKGEILERALLCKGWTDKAKLSVLFDLAKKTEHLEGDILEIGSAWGRSTVVMASAAKKTIWSIDPHTGGLAFIQKGEQQNSYDEFVQNLSKYDLLHMVRILRNTTYEVMSQNLLPLGARFSLVFIDGLHTPDGVRIDVQFAYDRLVSGGIMVFDDYFEPSVKDYSAMIDKLVQDKKASLIRDQEAQLVFFYKPDS